MKRLSLSIGFACALATAMWSSSTQDAKTPGEALDIDGQSSLRSRISELPALTEEKAIPILKALAKDRYDIESKLVPQLASDIPVDRKIPAIFLLGLYRTDTPAVVEHLLKHITVQVPEKSHFHMPLWHTQPAVEALIRIGKPATKALLNHLEKVQDERVRRLSIKVISRIEGQDVGKFILERAVAKQTDPEKKKNLQDAAKYFAVEN